MKMRKTIVKVLRTEGTKWLWSFCGKHGVMIGINIPGIVGICLSLFKPWG